MQRLINNQRNSSELVGKQHDLSDLSLGERLRQTEFIDSEITGGGANPETSHFDMKKKHLPSNKYTSETS